VNLCQAMAGQEEGHTHKAFVGFALLSEHLRRHEDDDDLHHES
jgi:hypothetical protein